jgi:hypothetical protein
MSHARTRFRRRPKPRRLTPCQLFTAIHEAVGAGHVDYTHHASDHIAVVLNDYPETTEHAQAAISAQPGVGRTEIVEHSRTPIINVWPAKPWH